ncbi:hypothetical protein [Actinoalloteichus spitiensis]|uniref:hypothetical protein n=1 Tax=Actinoalloteichus spitiensis TaxID=252394 RepID=UPI00036102FF|nr:hypothetical protein [Actinoalloteichus spitiensis]
MSQPPPPPENHGRTAPPPRGAVAVPRPGRPRGRLRGAVALTGGLAVLLAGGGGAAWYLSRPAEPGTAPTAPPASRTALDHCALVSEESLRAAGTPDFQPFSPPGSTGPPPGQLVDGTAFCYWGSVGGDGGTPENSLAVTFERHRGESPGGADAAAADWLARLRRDGPAGEDGFRTLPDLGDEAVIRTRTRYDQDVEAHAVARAADLVVQVVHGVGHRPDADGADAAHASRIAEHVAREVLTALASRSG